MLQLFKENVLFVGLKQYSGSLTIGGISFAKSCPMFAKWQLKASAISNAELFLLSSISISAMTFFLCWRELNSLIGCHVLRGSFLLAARLSSKYLRLAYLIKLLTSFLATLKAAQ